MSKSNRVLVSDFGMSRSVAEVGSGGNYYDSGGVLPYRWCPPEMILKTKSTRQSDIWMLGEYDVSIVVLVERVSCRGK